MKCKLCGSGNIKITYEGKIRDGRVGNHTLENIKMYECIECSTIWHEDTVNHSDYYETKEYREHLEGTSDIEDFYEMHDPESLDKFRYTGTTLFRNKVVADVGCGGGAFLDYINTVADRVIAIEPSETYREKMGARGYITFPYMPEALKCYKEKIDVIVSFDVIEHVEDPVQFVKEAYELLAPNGVAIIGTPTDAPVMRELLGEAYESFLFSTQHPWVLRKGSFDYISNKLGIEDWKVEFYQRYGLGNAINWMINKTPGKHITYDFISNTADMCWRSELERQGKSDYLCYVMEKH